jgi:hypothetical protein
LGIHADRHQGGALEPNGLFRSFGERDDHVSLVIVRDYGWAGPHRFSRWGIGFSRAPLDREQHQA